MDESCTEELELMSDSCTQCGEDVPYTKFPIGIHEQVVCIHCQLKWSQMDLANSQQSFFLSLERHYAEKEEWHNYFPILGFKWVALFCIIYFVYNGYLTRLLNLIPK